MTVFSLVRWRRSRLERGGAEAAQVDLGHDLVEPGGAQQARLLLPDTQPGRQERQGRLPPLNAHDAHYPDSYVIRSIGN